MNVLNPINIINFNQSDHFIFHFCNNSLVIKALLKITCPLTHFNYNFQKNNKWRGTILSFVSNKWDSSFIFGSNNNNTIIHLNPFPTPPFTFSLICHHPKLFMPANYPIPPPLPKQTINLTYYLSLSPFSLMKKPQFVCCS